MKCISNNPFRVLSLPVTASAREIEKRISDLKIYAEMGKCKRLEWDLSLFDPIDRSLELITEASNHIEQPDSKLYHALFWFCESNHIDEMALDLVREGKVEKAIDIFIRAVQNHSITDRNWSNYKNLSLLLLSLSVHNGHLDQNYYRKGLGYARNWLIHPFLMEYSVAVTNRDYTERITDLYGWFVEQFLANSQTYIDVKYGIDLDEFIALFSDFPEEISGNVMKRFVNKPKENILHAIAECKSLRLQKPQNANIFAVTLSEKANENREVLEQILGDEHYEYISLCDKTADEILRCSIDYFNEMHDINGDDVIETALDLVYLAEEFAQSDGLIDKIEGGISTLEERKSDMKLQASMEHIKEFIEIFDESPRNVQIKMILSFFSKEHESPVNLTTLRLLENQWGDEGGLYLELSSILALRFLNICIAVANHSQEYQKVLEIMNLIKQMDMDTKASSHFIKNYTIIQNNIKVKHGSTLTELFLKKYKITGVLSTQEPSSEEYHQRRQTDQGCFIATAVYGNYDAPEVVLLRRFRDTCLCQYALGRVGISVYYYVSPFIADRLRHFPTSQWFVRWILNRIVRRLQ
jgi:hypothetical protein